MSEKAVSNKWKKFPHTKRGYDAAVKWIKKIGKWDEFKDNGFSSLIAEANDLYADERKNLNGKQMMCESKASYGSEIEAYMALETIWNKGQVMDNTPTRSYKCPICNKWHLSSKKSVQE